MNNVEDVLKSEYSEEFDRKRKNRVAVSYYKYGPARKKIIRDVMELFGRCWIFKR